jgi:two-component system, NtrC family, response regulator HydG
MKKRILIIDDDVDICNLMARFLTKYGYETDTAQTGNKGLAKVKESPFDIVFCDYRLGDKNGSEVLTGIKEISPSTIVLIITGYSDIKTAVNVIKLGAFDYITKPLIPDEVLNVINNSLNQQSSSPEIIKEESAGSKKEKSSPHNFNNTFYVGKSGPTKELYKQIEIVAPTNYSIILYGESGTGKEVIAKTIHEYSDRKNKPFIAMDCGTISKELSGSELFGHVKGAFTGALNDKEGHFELANGGTLFLDEVANLSYDIQAALLRVIQERKFKRVGGTKEMHSDVRIIVASNENLQQAYQKGKFREDLYHRFNEFSINLPPLRKRKDDIEPLANFFLEKTNAELGKNIKSFEDNVIKLFLNYPWPGNLREMRNVVRRAVLLADEEKISDKTLPFEITNFNESFIHEELLTGSDNSFQSDSSDLKNTTAKAEYHAIINVLKEVNNNKTKAAEILNIDRKTLYNKIKNYEKQ